MDLSGMHIELPHLALIDDLTDTWSHDIEHYNEGPEQLVRWEELIQGESGPLVDVLVQRGTIGLSPIQAEWRVYNMEKFVELRLSIGWREVQKVLKLVIHSPETIVSREDGIMGGSLVRESDGVERPLQNRTLLCLSDGRKIGVVCPDTYALDVTPQRARLTLLRSPFMAHHAPCSGDLVRRTVADRGEHTFMFRFMAGNELQKDMLDTMALNLLQPPVISDVTKGMARGE